MEASDKGLNGSEYYLDTQFGLNKSTGQLQVPLTLVQRASVLFGTRLLTQALKRWLWRLGNLLELGAQEPVF